MTDERVPFGMPDDMAEQPGPLDADEPAPLVSEAHVVAPDAPPAPPAHEPEAASSEGAESDLPTDLPAEAAAALDADEAPTQVPEQPPEAVPAAEATPPQETAGEVPPLTAADIPALEGCDVEQSWAGDATCPGTETIEAEPEAEVVPTAVIAEAEEPATAEPAAEAQPAAEEPVAETPATVILAPQPEPVAEIAPQVIRSPIWPFALYLVAWAGLCLLAGWQLLQVPLSQPIAASLIYRYTVIGGVIMTVVGPILILAVWLWCMLRADEDTVLTGLFASTLLKGSVVTFLGVVMWWGTLLVVDQVRLGRLL